MTYLLTAGLLSAWHSTPKLGEWFMFRSSSESSLYRILINAFLAPSLLSISPLSWCFLCSEMFWDYKCSQCSEIIKRRQSPFMVLLPFHFPQVISSFVFFFFFSLSALYLPKMCYNSLITEALHLFIYEFISFFSFFHFNISQEIEEINEFV